MTIFGMSFLLCDAASRVERKDPVYQAKLTLIACAGGAVDHRPYVTTSCALDKAVVRISCSNISAGLLWRSRKSALLSA